MNLNQIKLKKVCKGSKKVQHFTEHPDFIGEKMCLHFLQDQEGC